MVCGRPLGLMTCWSGPTSTSLPPTPRTQSKSFSNPPTHKYSFLLDFMTTHKASIRHNGRSLTLTRINKISRWTRITCSSLITWSRLTMRTRSSRSVFRTVWCCWVSCKVSKVKNKRNKHNPWILNNLQKPPLPLYPSSPPTTTSNCHKNCVWL